MTDHERLCELLARFTSVCFDANTMLTRLRSNGPDGLRVVPVEPTDHMCERFVFVMSTAEQKYDYEDARVAYKTMLTAETT